MGIKLFDIQNSNITPTEHCYTIASLKKIMDEYPEDFNNIYTYLFYMSCLNEEENPFSNVPESDKRDMVLSQVGGDFDPDDPDIEKALEVCRDLYKTPTYNLYMASKVGIEKISKYITSTMITQGRDGNDIAYLKYVDSFDKLCKSFEGRYNAFKQEQSTIARGGHQIAYDQ